MTHKKIKPSITELAPYIVQSLDEGKRVKLTVTGNSMYPLFRDGKDSVTIEKTSVFKKYDIVLYKRHNGQYVLHRIISSKPGSFIFAGDNETTKECGISSFDCLAKVTSFERSGETFKTDALWHKIYCRIWVWFFPARRTLGKVLHIFAKLLHKFIFKS